MPRPPPRNRVSELYVGVAGAKPARMAVLRLVFLGSDAIALPLLEWLASDGKPIADLVAVFTQPDRPVGRGQKVQPNEIKQWGASRGVPVLQPEKLTPDVQAELASFRADVALVMAYGHILRDDFIGTPRLGTLNLHTSILPRYRGASPIQTAVANGERETGVSLMRIVRKLDAGPVAAVERVTIDALDTAADIEAKLAAATVPLLQRGLAQLAAGTLVFAPQDDSAATHCRKLTKEDGALDFHVSASALAARINGLFPWPTCVVEINGQPIKLGLADVAPGPAAEGTPGTVLGSDTLGLLVATSAGVLRLRRMQRRGGKMLPAADFLRGFPVATGMVIPSKPMTSLVSAAK
jgi:methionyl-tRNA formyltransferase